jgi:hypothetical protein
MLMLARIFGDADTSNELKLALILKEDADACKNFR